MLDKEVKKGLHEMTFKPKSEGKEVVLHEGRRVEEQTSFLNRTAEVRVLIWTLAYFSSLCLSIFADLPSSLLIFCSVFNLLLSLSIKFFISETVSSVLE